MLVLLGAWLTFKGCTELMNQPRWSQVPIYPERICSFLERGDNILTLHWILGEFLLASLWIGPLMLGLKKKKKIKKECTSLSTSHRFQSRVVWNYSGRAEAGYREATIGYFTLRHSHFWWMRCTRVNATSHWVKMKNCLSSCSCLMHLNINCMGSVLSYRFVQHHISSLYSSVSDCLSVSGSAWTRAGWVWSPLDCARI